MLVGIQAGNPLQLVAGITLQDLPASDDATFDFVENGNLSKTLFRGRWGSAATGRIYITDGAAMNIDQDMIAALKAALEQWSACLWA